MLNPDARKPATPAEALRAFERYCRHDPTAPNSLHDPMLRYRKPRAYVGSWDRPRKEWRVATIEEPAPWRAAVALVLAQYGRTEDVDAVAAAIEAHDPIVGPVAREQWPAGAAERPHRWELAVVAAANRVRGGVQ
jgi:hypothetical protein